MKFSPPKFSLSTSSTQGNPPAYSSGTSTSATSTSATPATSASSSTAAFHFTIGTKRTTGALVQLQEIKSHLALLHAFHELRTEVESDNHPLRGHGVPEDKEKRWGWVVALAVERWYGEDGLRGSIKALRELDGHFSRALQSNLHEFLTTLPSPSRVAFWQKKTRLPFHYAPTGMTEMKGTEIQCPLCLGAIYTEYMKPDGTGYLQEDFRLRCPHECGIGDITKEKLGVRRLANDLSDPLAVVAGTDFQAPTLKDRFFSNAAQVRVLEAAQIEIPTTVVAQEAAAVGLMKWAKFKLERLGGAMVFTGPERRCGRILSAYHDDRPYSVDLRGAVLRQASFVKKMYELGWTRAGRFDNHNSTGATQDEADEDRDREMVLHRAVARYHGFLDLLSSWPTALYVPTLDIDLIWHTHQLLSVRYEKDTVRYVGRFIDHDDKVEGLRLSSAFDNTCKAWKDKFKVSYTYCGCPHPGHKADSSSSDVNINHTGTIEAKLAGQIKLLQLSRLVNSATAKLSVLPSSSPSVWDDESTLVPPSQADATSATHPSDHNAVRFINPPIKSKGGRDIAKFRFERMKRKYEALEKHRRQRVGKVRKSGRVVGGGGFGHGGGGGGARCDTAATLNSNPANDDSEDANHADLGGNGLTLKGESHVDEDEDEDEAYSAYYASFLGPLSLLYDTETGRARTSQDHDGDSGLAVCVASQGQIVHALVVGCGNVSFLTAYLAHNNNNYYYLTYGVILCYCVVRYSGYMWWYVWCRRV
ncbi:hypothetical protein CVT24_002346 [Panaeolus cyanescens]|uniref:Uncharacterized protein n=1 Tax=Panaeolus cyanescens TaxID=181874 RepID=A0A409W165_9AGAR|nr:hypothetical protein CVT24_002346 [Panaeolus cyanescens]